MGRFGTRRGESSRVVAWKPSQRASLPAFADRVWPRVAAARRLGQLDHALRSRRGLGRVFLHAVLRRAPWGEHGARVATWPAFVREAAPARPLLLGPPAAVAQFEDVAATGTETKAGDVLVT